jgi:hypothetical protein
MLQYLKAMLVAKRDKKNLQKRIESLEKAIEQHLVDHQDLTLKALELLERVENKLDGRKGGRPKKEEPTENNISKSIILSPDGNPISTA